MSDQLGSLMREATAPLHVVWEEPVSLRRRAARRRVWRRVAVALVSVGLLGAGGGIALAPAGPPPCVAQVPLPSPPAPFDRGPNTFVRSPSVRVYHKAIGVAENVAAVLRDRGFDVVEVARTDESTSYYSAVIRYGPEVGTGAYVLKAQFEPWEVYMEFDLERTGPADLVLGSRFQLHEVCG